MTLKCKFCKQVFTSLDIRPEIAMTECIKDFQLHLSSQHQTLAMDCMKQMATEQQKMLGAVDTINLFTILLEADSLDKLSYDFVQNQLRNHLNTAESVLGNLRGRVMLTQKPD